MVDESPRWTICASPVHSRLRKSLGQEFWRWLGPEQAQVLGFYNTRPRARVVVDVSKVRVRLMGRPFMVRFNPCTRVPVYLGI
jgi:hypothetical protein